MRALSLEVLILAAMIDGGLQSADHRLVEAAAARCGLAARRDALRTPLRIFLAGRSLDRDALAGVFTVG